MKKDYKFYLYLTATKLYFFATNNNTEQQASIIYSKNIDFPFLTNYSSLNENEFVNAVSKVDELCDSFTKIVDPGNIVNDIILLINPLHVKTSHFEMEIKIPPQEQEISYEQIMNLSRNAAPKIEDYSLVQLILDKLTPIYPASAPKGSTKISPVSNSKTRASHLKIDANGYHLKKTNLSPFFKLFSKTYVKVSYFMLLPITLHYEISEHLKAQANQKNYSILHLDLNTTSYFKYDSTGKIKMIKHLNYGVDHLINYMKSHMFKDIEIIQFWDILYLMMKYSELISKTEYLNKYFTYKNIFIKNTQYFNDLKEAINDFIINTRESLTEFGVNVEEEKIYVLNSPSILVNAAKLITSGENYKNLIYFENNNISFDNFEYADLFSAIDFNANVIEKRFKYKINPKNK